MGKVWHNRDPTVWVITSITLTQIPQSGCCDVMHKKLRKIPQYGWCHNSYTTKTTLAVDVVIAMHTEVNSTAKLMSRPQCTTETWNCGWCHAQEKSLSVGATMITLYNKRAWAVAWQLSMTKIIQREWCHNSYAEDSTLRVMSWQLCTKKNFSS